MIVYQLFDKCLSNVLQKKVYFCSLFEQLNMPKSTLKITLRTNYLTVDNKKPLCLQYIAYRQSTFISLNINLTPEQWDNNLKSIVNTPYSNQYNTIITQAFDIAQNILFENYLSPLTTKEFYRKYKEELDPSPKKNNNYNFYIFIEREIELLKSDRGDGTISNYYKLINSMKKWRPKLKFGDITFEYIQQYHNYCIETGNLESTIYKKHANFKFLLGLCIAKGKLNKNPYDKFPVKKNIKSQNNNVLTEEELRKLQKTYDDDQYSDGKKEVLRNFLFSCYTGLSFAEFNIVSFSHLTKINMEDKGEYILLCNERTKTGTTYKIPIVSPIVRNLVGIGKSRNRIFHYVENQPTNRYLKEIMEDMEIDKYITFHTARHKRKSYRLLINKLRMCYFSIGNDLETNLVLRYA